MNNPKPKISPALPRGMRDLLPDQLAIRHKVIETHRRVFELYGFQPLETPAMERLDILSGKGGEESDKLSFLVMKRGAELERALEKVIAGKASLKEMADLGLRFEFTISLARVVAQYQGKLPMPFKRYQIGTVWRAERPQHGRYREFTQCDIDIVGTTSPFSDAEIVAIYADVYSALGLDVEIIINDRRLLTALSKSCGNNPEQFIAFCSALDKLDKIGWDGVLKEMAENGLNSEKHQLLMLACEKRYEIAGELITEDAKLSQFIDVPELISELGDFHRLILNMGLTSKARIVFDPTLARGLEYYTGFVVEAKLAGSSVGSLGGGGRYDNLVGSFLKESIPAVGASFGLDRIVDVLSESPAYFKAVPQVISILFAKEIDRNMLATAGQLTSDLRSYGAPVEIGYLSDQKLGKQMQGAVKRGNAFVIILGEESQESGFEVKRLSDGKQRRLTLPQIVEWTKEAAK